MIRRYAGLQHVTPHHEIQYYGQVNHLKTKCHTIDHLDIRSKIILSCLKRTVVQSENTNKYVASRFDTVSKYYRMLVLDIVEAIFSFGGILSRQF